MFYGATDFVFDYAGAAHSNNLLNSWDTFAGLCRLFHASLRHPPRRLNMGTPINDYREYIENMACMRLNQLTLWNDHLPLNAADIIAAPATASR